MALQRQVMVKALTPCLSPFLHVPLPPSIAGNQKYSPHDGFWQNSGRKRSEHDRTGENRLNALADSRRFQEHLVGTSRRTRVWHCSRPNLEGRGEAKGSGGDKRPSLYLIHAYHAKLYVFTSTRPRKRN
ncbi:hypothetical protein E2C01_038073 [Portunus trituberculatus]|uniref:Uncharacterized protein n=1 Tax=Portunus trituberculatus TaxID=210409 RepID=A0A5B7F9V3_PORTR|nr:hypothetical protein [Portunus trituberculatus]